MDNQVAIVTTRGEMDLTEFLFENMKGFCDLGPIEQMDIIHESILDVEQKWVSGDFSEFVLPSSLSVCGTECRVLVKVEIESFYFLRNLT